MGNKSIEPVRISLSKEQYDKIQELARMRKKRGQDFQPLAIAHHALDLGLARCLDEERAL